MMTVPGVPSTSRVPPSLDLCQVSNLNPLVVEGRNILLRCGAGHRHDLRFNNLRSVPFFGDHIEQIVR